MVLALSPCGGCFFCVFFLRFYPNVRSYIRTYKTYNKYDPTQVSEESVLHTCVRSAAGAAAAAAAAATAAALCCYYCFFSLFVT